MKNLPKGICSFKVASRAGECDRRFVHAKDIIQVIRTYPQGSAKIILREGNSLQTVMSVESAQQEWMTKLSETT